MASSRLLPVTTIGLLYGSKRGAQAGAVAFALNVILEYIAHGYSLMLTTASGVVGNLGMIGLGWLVGYLRDLSQSRLRQVVEEKDRLIGTISHELRTPLSTVVGLSHELTDRATSFTTDEVAEFCGLIAQQSSELEALIEDLLVAARADIERIKVLKVPVDLGDCVTSAVAVATEGWPSAKGEGERRRRHRQGRLVQTAFGFVRSSAISCRTPIGTVAMTSSIHPLRQQHVCHHSQR